MINELFNEQEEIVQLDERRKHIVCPTRTCEEIDVTVPVEVHARAKVGHIELKCGGHHIVREHEHPRSVSRFEIVQKVSAQIPIEFITEVHVKDECVDYHVHDCHHHHACEDAQ